MKTGIVVSKYSLTTQLIHGPARARGWEYSHAIHPPIVRSNAHRLETVKRGHQAFSLFATPEGEKPDEQPLFIYERLHGPVKTMLQEQMALLEEGNAARVFASGMAAINSTLFSVLKNGQKILSDKVLYGCTFSLFTRGMPRRGISVDFIDTSNTNVVAAAISSQTRVIYFESPANPNLKLTDMLGIRKIVDEVNKNRKTEDQIIVIMDNTFATPYAQRPLNLGIDMVVHSMTKNLNGFATRIGGVVVFNDVGRFLPDIDMELKDGGGVMTDETAWDFLVYGLPTLQMRMQIKTKNAETIAEFLENHQKVGKGNIFYPGLPSFPQYDLARKQMSTGFSKIFSPGDMIYFQLAPKLNGERNAHLARTERFLDYIASNSYPITLGVSLGIIKTMIESPGLMTHSSYNAEQLSEAGLLLGGIRLAVGTEEVQDLIDDLNEALDQAA
jgi:cystathionine beta-lyase/cystathionine gamma-synthase